MQAEAICRHLRFLGVKQIRIEGNGEWVNGECPFAPWRHEGGHDDRPSFGVHVEYGTSWFYCHGCHSTGKLHELYTELGVLRGEDYRAHRDAVTLEEARSAPPFERDARQAQPDLAPVNEQQVFAQYPPYWAQGDAQGYVRGRGVSDYTGRLMGLRADYRRKRVLFPVRDRDGLLYGFTGRLYDPDSDMPKVLDYEGLPKRDLLLGENLADPRKPFAVVEGPFDYAHLIELGLREWVNPVAVLGSVLTPPKAARLIEWGQPVYLMFDNDQAGDVGLWGPMDEWGKHRHFQGAMGRLHPDITVEAPDYPDGVTEPDGLTLQQAKDMLGI